jgi:hypothetical protein
MSKKAIIILIIVILIGLGLSLRSVFAQRYYEQKPMVACEDLILIEENLDKALALLKEKGNKEILKKLDQILQNQAQIKDELKIIKVRASR